MKTFKQFMIEQDNTVRNAAMAAALPAASLASDMGRAAWNAGKWALRTPVGRFVSGPVSNAYTAYEIGNWLSRGAAGRERGSRYIPSRYGKGTESPPIVKGRTPNKLPPIS